MSFTWICFTRRNSSVRSGRAGVAGWPLERLGVKARTVTTNVRTVTKRKAFSDMKGSSSGWRRLG